MRKAKTTTTVVSLIAAALLALLITALLTGCSEADKVNANISKQADYFGSERRITVYNARTDKIILEAEGYMSISNNGSSELVVTCKVGQTPPYRVSLPTALRKRPDIPRPESAAPCSMYRRSLSDNRGGWVGVVLADAA